MSKKNPAARKSSTHFEQIPLEGVKKIAEVEGPRKVKAGAGKSRTPKVRP